MKTLVLVDPRELLTHEGRVERNPLYAHLLYDDVVVRRGIEFRIIRVDARGAWGTPTRDGLRELVEDILDPYVRSEVRRLVCEEGDIAGALALLEWWVCGG